MDRVQVQTAQGTQAQRDVANGYRQTAQQIALGNKQERQQTTQDPKKNKDSPGCRGRTRTAGMWPGDRRPRKRSEPRIPHRFLPKRSKHHGRSAGGESD